MWRITCPYWYMRVWGVTENYSPPNSYFRLFIVGENQNDFSDYLFIKLAPYPKSQVVHLFHRKNKILVKGT